MKFNPDAHERKLVLFVTELSTILQKEVFDRAPKGFLLLIHISFCDFK